MPLSLWTHAFMDAMRQRADPLADDVIAQIFASGKVGVVNQLMRTLVENDELPSNQLPLNVMEYLVRTKACVPRLDPDKLKLAQEVFDLFGPEVMMILGFYALPAAYAARKGVQVLHRTGFLRERTVRRVFETAQMVVDVMTEGGLQPDGRGVRSLQKVRLMHASIRHMLRQDPRGPWNSADLGEPINQEDLTGTLMTFSFVVLEGMKSLHIELTRPQQEAWIYAWGAAGRILGIDERLIPLNLEEARGLTYFIRERQVEPSPEGVALTASLIEGMQHVIPTLLEGLPATVIRFFLERDQWQGLNVAELLHVPPADWTSVIPRAVRRVGGLTDWMGQQEVTVKLMRNLSKEILAGMLRAEFGDRRTAFHIPAQLQDKWCLPSPSSALAQGPRAPDDPLSPSSARAHAPGRRGRKFPTHH